MFFEKKEPMYYLRQEGDSPDLPQKLYIEPTSLCNLNCSMCFRNGWIDERKGHMDMDLFEKLAGEVAGLSHIEELVFGGMGEPLYHPQICGMIRLLPRDRKISLLTNAVMLTPAMSEELIRFGLTQLWVSVDGFERESYETIRRGSLFDRILENLDGFNHARAGAGRPVRLGLTFVVTPENEEQLEKINSFADRFRADELNISHMIPWEPVRKEDTLYERNDIPVGKMRRFMPPGGDVEEHVCPFISRNAVFVRWDGNVAPCMQLLHSCYTYLYEERRKITAFFYGNIRDRTLMDCWQDPSYAEFRQRVRVFYFPFCRVCWGCEDRKENLTDCAYGEAPTCGACLWASGRIFCP